MTITGTNLSNATGVAFGSVPGTIVSDSGTVIVATTPAKYVGVVDTTVTTAASLTTAVSAGDKYTYIPTVTLSTIDIPANGTVTINGYGFDPVAANDSVSFTDGAAGTVSSATPTRLVVTLSTPATLLGVLSATVTVDSFFTSASPVQVATMEPVITVNVNGATFLGNNQMVGISGYGFGSTATNDILTFNDGAAATVTSTSSTSLNVAFLNSGAGESLPKSAGLLLATLNVTVGGVTYNTGAPVQVSTVYLQIIAGPTITAGATTETITGAGFDPNTANDYVSFTTPGVVGTVTSATTSALVITFSSPLTTPEALNADISVNGIGEYSGSEPGNTGPFAVGAVAPIVTPSSATLTINPATITINGNYFSTTTSLDTVAFTDGAVGSVTAVTATSLTVTFSTKPSYVGSLLATVTVNGGTAARVEVASLVTGTSFTPGNLIVLDVTTVATTISATSSLFELKPGTASQSSTVQTIAIGSSTATGSVNFRFSAEDGGDLLADSNDGTEVVFDAYNSSSTIVTTAQDVGALSSNTALTQAATYTSAASKYPDAATTLNDTQYYMGTTSALYSNTTAGSITGTAVTTSPAVTSVISVKSFGGTVYLLATTSSGTFIYTLNTSTNAITPLPGLTTDTTTKDFYLVSSGSNGSTYDVLYTLDETSATAGTIHKFSLVSGSWVAESTFATTGGQTLAAAVPALGSAYLYYTTGASTSTDNSLIRLTDAHGWDATESIGSAITLYTATSGELKGVAFTPIGTQPTVTANTADLTLATSTITIAGTNFSATSSNDTVTFTDGAVGTVSSATATSLVVGFTTEPTAAGTLSAIVSVTGNGNSGSAVQVATYGLVVTASSVNVATNASTITIAGIGFDPNSANDTVSFNLGAVGSVTSASSTSLVVTFSTDPTAYGNLTATVSTTSNGSSSSTQVGTVPAPSPTVTASSANLQNNAATITITGTNFGSSAFKRKPLRRRSESDGPGLAGSRRSGRRFRQPGPSPSIAVSTACRPI